LDEEKAIVTNIAGTTRDIVEGKTILDGNIINFIDTAGIRSSEDIVEQIGVEKSLKQIDCADLIILVLNYSEKLSVEETGLIDKIKDKKHIIFINKNDLEKKLDIIKSDNVVYGNTVNVDGLDSLKSKIKEYFKLDPIKKGDFTYLSNARQLSLIQKAKEAIDSAINGTENSIPVDVLAIDLMNARNALSDILGEKYNDELIDELFSKFCLGK